MSNNIMTFPLQKIDKNHKSKAYNLHSYT